MASKAQYGDHPNFKTDRACVPRPEANLICEGWLDKHGDFLRHWKPRYFMLWDDGSFLGYKEKPGRQLPEAHNHFTVKNCLIKTSEKHGHYVFHIFCLQLTNVVERKFRAESDSDRSMWLAAINQVTQLVNKKSTTAIDHSDNMTIDDFQRLKSLGHGKYGKVILTRERKTGKIHAIKIIDKVSVYSKVEVMHMVSERKILEITKHPFITEFRYTFETEENLYFVMEYVTGGDLYFHLNREKMFSEPRSCFYGAQITSALGYLHTHRIVYRDLKLENILLGADGYVKLADFGLAKENMDYDTTTLTVCGTPMYMAPEVVQHQDYGRAVDWWSLGVLTYEMVTGRPPFAGTNRAMLAESISSDPVKFPLHVSDEATSFIEKLLERDPYVRLGGGIEDYQEVQVHAFFSTVDWELLVQKKIPAPFVPELTSETDTRYFRSSEDETNFA